MLDQESVRIIIGLQLKVPDLALGDQFAVNGAAGTDQFLGRIAGKYIGELFAFQRCAIYFDFLRDIGGNQVIVVA